MKNDSAHQQRIKRIDRQQTLVFPMAEYEEPADQRLKQSIRWHSIREWQDLLEIFRDLHGQVKWNRLRIRAIVMRENMPDAHSIRLHLFGYDHMKRKKRKIWKKRREEILTKTKYTRDERGLV